jgi:hypothetical protein
MPEEEKKTVDIDTSGPETEINVPEEKEDQIGQPKYQMMDYAKLTPLLVKAVQEQQTIIDDLKSRIETLEG